MKYCKKCLSTNLRPNSKFIDGVCIACRYNDRSLDIPGDVKLKQLKTKISRMTRSKRNNKFDCMVGVSGGKDSTRQAHWVRDRLGLRPLLICVGYPPKQMSNTGAENLQNLIEMGFELIIATPAPKTSARLSLASFEKFGNVAKSTEIALFSTVPRIAIDMNINLIFWGENPALQVGDSAVLGVDEFDGNNLRNLNTLQEGTESWMEDFNLDDYKLKHYIYPSETDFYKKKINILYLGAAWDDWSNEENATYAALQGLELKPNMEHLTGDLSNASMLDEEFTNINMMLKYYKFGFGRATDQVNELIRNGKITRAQGIKIVEKYDGVCSDQIIQRYCEYVGITERYFWKITNNWVNADLFNIHDYERPVRKFEVGSDSSG